MAKATYKVGDKVDHPADPGGKFPEGSGVVTEVITAGDSHTYKVRCDTTGKVLPTAFKEDDLTAA